MADSFGLKIGLEGEKEFKKALAEINQSFKVLGSEMKLVTSQFDKNDSSADALAAKHKVLGNQIEAQKQKMIKEAEGQAEAIRAIQKANAQGIESIKAAKADNAVIQLKSLEAFAKAADGKATKIIIPSEIQGMAGLVKSITEVAKDDEKNIADLIEEQVQDTVKEQ